MQFYFFRVSIEIVLREKGNGKTLSAEEAIDLINQDKVKNKLESQNFKVHKVDQGELKNNFSFIFIFPSIIYSASIY